MADDRTFTEAALQIDGPAAPHPNRSLLRRLIVNYRMTRILEPHLGWLQAARLAWRFARWGL